MSYSPKRRLIRDGLTLLALMKDPKLIVVNRPKLAVKPLAKTSGGSSCPNSGRANFSEEFLTLSTAAEQLEFIR